MLAAQEHQNSSAVAHRIRVPMVVWQAMFGPVVSTLPSMDSSLTPNVASRVGFIPAKLHKHSGGKVSNSGVVLCLL